MISGNFLATASYAEEKHIAKSPVLQIKDVRKAF